MTKRKPDAVINMWDDGGAPTVASRQFSASAIKFANDCLPSGPRVTHRILVYLKDMRG